MAISHRVGPPGSATPAPVLAGGEATDGAPEVGVRRLERGRPLRRAGGQAGQSSGLGRQPAGERDSHIGHHPAHKCAGDVVGRHPGPVSVRHQEGVLSQLFGYRRPPRQGVGQRHHVAVLALVKGGESVGRGFEVDGPCSGGWLTTPIVARQVLFRMAGPPGALVATVIAS